LPNQTRDEIDYSYHRIFKFLADILGIDEFQSLTFYHINRLISHVTKSVKQPISTFKNQREEGGNLLTEGDQLDSDVNQHDFTDFVAD